MSAEQDYEYLADGIAEEILNLLAKAPAVTVIARSSSFSFKNQNVDIATIAETLNVTHVLEGSLRKAGNHVRITARFVDATTSAQLWSATYDRELDDVFAVQSEIAGAVVTRATRNARRLGSCAKPRLRTVASTSAICSAGFSSTAASPATWQRAENAYRQALADRPLVREGMGRARGRLLRPGGRERPAPPQALLAKLRDAVDEALRLDPQLAEAHIRLSGYFLLTGDETRYEEEIRIAATLAPEDPLVLGVLALNAARAHELMRSIDLAKSGRGSRSAVARGSRESRRVPVLCR